MRVVLGLSVLRPLPLSGPKAAAGGLPRGWFGLRGGASFFYGGGGIRTHEGLRPPVFKTGALDRSATPPQKKMELTASYFN